MSTDLIPAGYYTARAVRVQDDFGDSVWARFSRAKTGTKQVLVVFEVTESDWAGRKLPWFGSFTENSWQRTVQSLQYCGFTGDDLTVINRQKLDNQVSICVEHETNAGKTYARVAWVNESGGVKLADPMSRDDVRMFAAQMRGQISSVRGGATTTSARTEGGFDDRPPHPANDGDVELPI